jgi:MFS family permease
LGIKKILSRNLKIFIIIDIIRHFSIFIAVPYFSLYVIELGGSNVTIGIINALRPLAALFVYPIAGNVVDKYGRVKILWISNFINAILYAVYASAPDWRYLAIANFLHGLIVFRFPASSALLADSISSEVRGSSYAILSTIPSLLGIFSPFIGGYFTSYYGVKKAIRIMYGLTVIGTFTVSYLCRNYLEEVVKINKTEKSFKNIILESYREVWYTIKSMEPNLKRYSTVILSNLFFNSLAGAYWIIIATKQMGLNELQWGTILLLTQVVQVILTFPAGLLLDKYRKERIIAAALFFSVIPIILFPYSNSFRRTALLLILLGASNAILIPGASSLMAQLAKSKDKGKTMATLGRGMLNVNYKGGGAGGPGMGFLLTFPSVVGLYLSGYLFELNSNLPWIILGIATLLNGFFMLTIKKDVETY